MSLSCKLSVTILSAALVSLTASAAAAADICLEYSEPFKLGKVSTSKLPEISGLAVSRINPAVIWVHNDSGSDNRIYALALDGEYLGYWSLEGVGADDFEDIAYGPCADGYEGCLYIGDFGNNEGDRDKFQIYRVPEPDFDFFDALDDPIKDEIDKDLVEKIKFEYPKDLEDDGETPDAEAMLVDADGTITLFTKSKKGTRVLALEVPADLDERVAVEELGVRDDFFRATGADLAPDGGRFVVRNLDEAREFPILPGQTLAEAFVDNDYVSVSVGHEKQGEAIGYTADGWSLLTTSERDKEPVYLYDCLEWTEIRPGKEDGVGDTAATGGDAGTGAGCSTFRASTTRSGGLLALFSLLALLVVTRLTRR